MDAFGYTPDSVEGKAAQKKLALAAGDTSMVAAIFFDHAKDSKIPKTMQDPDANDMFPIS